MAADKQLKVAIVHDWLVGGGAERVVMELHNTFPDAPIYTSYCTPEWRERLDGKVVTGWLQHFGRLRKFLALGRIWWFTHLDFTGYDLVISSSGNGEAKGIRVPKGVTHVCYCHSPTHYYWRHYEQYLRRPGFGLFDPLARLGLRLLLGPLRRWDLRASSRPDYYIANSNHIKDDIKTYYGRDAVVIHPPIDVARFSPSVPLTERRSFITVGRQATYKRTDIIVEACSKLNLPLEVLGSGPDHERLKKLAGPSVTFLPRPSDAEVAAHMAHAKAFLFAAYEDFGVTPVEALAAGTPVIAFKAGGAFDYVVPGLTGQFFTEQTPESLARALKNYDPTTYDPQKIAKFAESFSPQAFAKKLRAFLKTIVK
ncbi:MAG TPA: glycosyltransferase [Candidatus Saccharimonadales bacterium]|nr:glycosyltransferase [Candidatus Saccharimonadales bacterium]